MNGLSVIIPSKSAANLRVCLRSLRECEPNCRIIVVDDGVDWAAIDASSIEIIAGIKPFIFARNCNIGIGAAGNDDVILLNDDALLKTKGGFALLQKAAGENPEYGCIGATTNVTGQILQKPQNKGLRALHHIAFICVLIPRRTIDRIGMLDERYCLDYGVEDRDYCETITRAGMQVGVHDGCFVDHSKLRSSYRGHPMAPGKSDKNRALFMQKFNIPVYRLNER
jgi:GT2 family glycosyltransferase